MPFDWSVLLCHFVDQCCCAAISLVFAVTTYWILRDSAFCSAYQRKIVSSKINSNLTADSVGTTVRDDANYAIRKYSVLLIRG